MSKKIESFEDLDCWKESRKLRRFVMKEVLSRIPKNQNYSMSDNLVRAARSMTRNIAEGFGRFHHGENAQFCSISRGSCLDVLDDLITCHDDGYISDALLAEGRDLVTTAVKLLNGYIRYLRSITNRRGPGRVTEDSPEWDDGYQQHRTNS